MNLLLAHMELPYPPLMVALMIFWVVMDGIPRLLSWLKGDRR